MKKLTILTILMFLMSTLAIAQSPPVPAPIIGKLTLNGQGLDGYTIEVKNTAIGKVVSGDTIGSLITEHGKFTVDLSKVDYEGPSRNYLGDVIQVKVRGFSDPQATVSFIPTQTPYYFDIKIVNTQTVYQCEDGSLVVNLNDCPEIVEPEPVTIYVCSDGSEVSDSSDCPKEEELETETKVISDGEDAYVEAYYGQEIEVSLNHNKLEKLINSEIHYDGDDYDVKEEIFFNGIIKTSIDDEDFGLDPYLVLEEESIEYRYTFKDSVPISDIHIEEPLEITFLGKEIKIIEASSNEIVLRSGEEYFLTEGQSKTIEGKQVKVVTIGEHSISVEVDGEQEIIHEEENQKVNGLNILVNEILYKSYEDSFVDILVGGEGDQEIKDGDDFELFEEEDIWKWVISLSGEQYIGIINQEEYRLLDEDYKPLTVGDSLTLPNEYVNINFKEVSESKLSELTFKVRNGYLNVKGDEDTFVYENEEYDEINVNSDGIYDEDEVIISDKVRIGNSDTYLELGSVKIGKLIIKLDMSDILYEGISYLAKEENYLDYFGIIFKNPEDAVDEQKGFKVIIPEERPEVTILFSSDYIAPEVIEPTPFIEPEPVPVEPTPVEPTPTTPPVTPTPTPVEPPVVPPVIEKIKCSDGSLVESAEDCPEGFSDKAFYTLLALVALILGALGIQWNRGMLGIVKYHWKAGRKMQAMKTLFTLVKKAKEGKYNK